MSKRKPLKTITLERSKKHHGSPRESRTIQRRRDSNDEVMHGCLLKRGYVRMRLYPFIWHADTDGYVGLHGGGTVIDAPSVAAAKKCLERVNEFIDAQIKELGIQVYRNVRKG